MKGTILDFLKLAVEKPELSKELVELAAKYEFEFIDEVSDEQLEDVAGGLTAAVRPMPSLQSAETDKSADSVMSSGELAAPFIPGGR